MKQILLFLILIVFSAASSSSELEAIVAGSGEQIDGQEVKIGLSAKVRLLLTSRNQPSGFFVQSNFLGGGIENFDAIAGYTIRTKGQTYLEFGGGWRYNRIFGSGGALVFGGGIRFNRNWHIALPIYYRMGFSYEFVPYLGIAL